MRQYGPPSYPPPSTIPSKPHIHILLTACNHILMYGPNMADPSGFILQD